MNSSSAADPSPFATYPRLLVTFVLFCNFHLQYFPLAQRFSHFAVTSEADNNLYVLLLLLLFFLHFYQNPLAGSGYYLLDILLSFGRTAACPHCLWPLLLLRWLFNTLFIFIGAYCAFNCLSPSPVIPLCCPVWLSLCLLN